MYKFQLYDGATGQHTVGVTQDKEICTIAAPYPPLVEQKVRPLRQYLTDDGTVTGSNDMGVDGSVTNQDFWIPADPTDDRYITTLNFIVGYGGSGQPNLWADGTALTNGMRLFYTSRHGEQDIHDSIKSNQDMFRLSFNPIPATWEVRHVNAANDYGYFTTFDLTKLGLPFGVKLDAGSNQKLVMRVRDNAGSAADSFDCIGYGFHRFK